MCPLTSKWQALSFYVNDEIREQQSNSEHGEVPDIFRKHRIQLAISGRHWATSSTWCKARLQAIIEIRHPADDTDDKASTNYYKLGDTETVHEEMHPQFVQRLELNALQMPDSQHVARHTFLRVRAQLGETEVGTAEMSLAQLVWELRHNSVLKRSDGNCTQGWPQPSVKVTVLRGRALREDGENKNEDDEDSHVVELWVRLRDSLWPDGALGEDVMQVCALTACERGGDWSRAVVENTQVRPQGKGRTARLVVARRTLVGYVDGQEAEGRMVRIEAVTQHTGVARVLGFCQFRLHQLAASGWVEWRVTGGKGNAHVVAVRASAPAPDLTRVTLDVGSDIPSNPRCVKHSLFSAALRSAWGSRWSNTHTRTRDSSKHKEHHHNKVIITDFDDDDFAFAHPPNPSENKVVAPQYSVRFPQQPAES